MVNKEKLLRKAFMVFSLAFAVIGLMLFLPAGTFEYWHGWIFMGIIFLPCVFVVSYLLKHDPELLKRRMKLKENTYTSRIVEVEKGQKVITTGPYSVIRHPMYFGVILMFIFMPMALGSYWAVIPLLPIVILIMFRALNEEKVLKRDLPGYGEYIKKVKYRLVPGIW